MKLVAGGGPMTRKENPNEWPVQRSGQVHEDKMSGPG